MELKYKDKIVDFLKIEFYIFLILEKTYGLMSNLLLIMFSYLLDKASHQSINDLGRLHPWMEI